MDRRDFLKKSSAGALGFSLSRPLDAAASRGATPPNILYIVVDEMRFPSVFPSGVNDAGQFLQAFMPNTYALWSNGVKFANHFTAGAACTPSRGALITGLYSQQTWMMQTLKGTPDTKISVPPVLDPVFPTYGKLLRKAGYQTPYIGKWHLSITRKAKELEPYGFDGMTHPDPTGANLQGSVGDHANGYLNDGDIAAQAAEWLSARQTGDQPWCLTVCLQNPHDHMFFWGGTEFQTYNALFDGQNAFQPMTYYSSDKGTDYPPVVSWDADILKSPPSYGYPALPPNWESAAQLKANKPSTHFFARTFLEFVTGGVSDDPNATGYSIVPYPGVNGYGTGVAPFSYWQRNLDSYTQILSLADQQVGVILSSLPAEVAANTVIVFTSDHGDYVGAHGLVSNKFCTAYDEAFHVPLIVVDPTGQFTGDIGTARDELTSSVDMCALLVSLGHGGSTDWMTGKYAKIYGGRHDMVPMLKSASAPGRSYSLLVTDELTMSNYIFNDAPLHIIGYRTKKEKLAVYVHWHDFSTRDQFRTAELEFYDYTTEGGRAEIDNTPRDPRVPALVKHLHSSILPNELRAPLPGGLGLAQFRAEQLYLEFAALMAHPPHGERSPKFLKKWLGFGADA